MASDARPAPEACAFCGGAALQRTHAGLFHPLKKDHGPFEFHRCMRCGSGLTIAPPPRERLGELYASFRDGLPDLHREITKDDPQTALYELCARRMLEAAGRALPPAPRWVDVGAGGGELSRVLDSLLPSGSGLAIDLHPEPVGLAGTGRVAWAQLDIDDDAFAERTGLLCGADLVISMSVWEHVIHPDRYARNLLRLLGPGGVLYLLCPDYGSVARRVLGRRWPYFTPGEHLNMPTAAGARACLSREWERLHPGVAPARVYSGPLALPYSLRYVLRRLGRESLGRLIPAGLAVPLPAGALESVLVASPP